MNVVQEFNVLVVEDNEIHQKLFLASLNRLSEILESEITTTIAHDGQEAVELATNEHYDVILMDVRLPKIDGLEATRQIRKIERTRQRYAVIVGVSAYAMEGDAAKGIAAGMDQYLTKPVNADEFVLTITNALATAVETDTGIPPDCEREKVLQ